MRVLIFLIMAYNFAFAALYSSETQDGIQAAYQEVDQVVNERTKKVVERLNKINQERITKINQEIQDKNKNLNQINKLDQYEYQVQSSKLFKVQQEQSLKGLGIDAQNSINEKDNLFDFLGGVK